VLQYHLYSLALHRYLERHIPQYDYRLHFGGVFYLFIRGIDPRSGAEYGLFRDRPEESLILALDRYMRGGER
jgi:exodeoxyribonuclease V beta subunit